MKQIKLCKDCGRRALRCKAVTGRGRVCRLPPKTCGFCHLHCKNHKRTVSG